MLFRLGPAKRFAGALWRAATSDEKGESYMVYVFHDHNTDRILASSKLNRYFDEEAPSFEPLASR